MPQHHDANHRRRAIETCAAASLPPRTGYDSGGAGRGYGGRMLPWSPLQETGGAVWVTKPSSFPQCPAGGRVSGNRKGRDFNLTEDRQSGVRVRN
ncbi:hypothetical protein E2C01_061832 [Portunus trituberculatus]|uniref:Uncharacterized protein n=1 Tax=Portunus trituberculatus TaxID=210409 RepID=A0A5B7HGE8_PORTR|nr:hypothetical protein [Portunus trituberculatus]